MPITYRCKRCGHVLYEFREVGQSYIGVPTPLEVIKLVGHICPSCKRVLEVPGLNFKEYVFIKRHVVDRIREERSIFTKPMAPSLGTVHT